MVGITRSKVISFLKKEQSKQWWIMAEHLWLWLLNSWQKKDNKVAKHLTHILLSVHWVPHIIYSGHLEKLMQGHVILLAELWILWFMFIDFFLRMPFGGADSRGSIVKHMTLLSSANQCQPTIGFYIECISSTYFNILHWITIGVFIIFRLDTSLLLRLAQSLKSWTQPTQPTVPSLSEHVHACASARSARFANK